jgi:hypothetical protein
MPCDGRPPFLFSVNTKHLKEERQKMTMAPVESKAMTSPNVRQNIGFDDALKALGSPEHAEFHAHAQRTVSSVSNDGVVEDALGD